MYTFKGLLNSMCSWMHNFYYFLHSSYLCMKKLLSRINFAWLIQGFLYHPQLTWGTPAGKREECSFKGKNLEVRGTFSPLLNIPQETSSIMTMTILKNVFFSCLLPDCPLWVVQWCLRVDKMSVDFCVDNRFHQLQIDSSSVQARQGIALFSPSLSLTVCYFVVIPAVVSQRRNLC